MVIIRNHDKTVIILDSRYFSLSRLIIKFLSRMIIKTCGYLFN